MAGVSRATRQTAMSRQTRPVRPRDDRRKPLTPSGEGGTPSIPSARGEHQREGRGADPGGIRLGRLSDGYSIMMTIPFQQGWAFVPAWRFSEPPRRNTSRLMLLDALGSNRDGWLYHSCPVIRIYEGTFCRMTGGRSLISGTACVSRISLHTLILHIKIPKEALIELGGTDSVRFFCLRLQKNWMY